MSLDHLPYRDFSDNKGPTTYVFYRMLDSFFGHNFFLWRLVFLGIIICCGLLLRSIALTALSRASSNAALLIFLLLSAQPSFQAFHASETIGVFFLLLSLYLLLCKNEQWNQGASGLSLAASALTSAMFLPAIPAFAVYFLAEKKLPSKSFLAGLFAPIVIFIIFLAVTSSLQDFIFWYFTYNLLYGQFVLQDGSTFTMSNFYTSPYFISFAFCAIFAFSIGYVKKNTPLLVILALFLISGATAFPRVMLTTPYHYYVAYVPFIAIGAASVFGFGLKHNTELSIIFISMFCLALIYSSFVSAPIPRYAPSVADNLFEQKLLSEKPYLANSSRVLAFGETMDPMKVYYLANSTYEGKYFFPFFFFSRYENLRADMESEFSRNLEEGKIDYIITDANWPREYWPSQIFRNALASNFSCIVEKSEFGERFYFQYCVRKNSDLPA